MVQSRQDPTWWRRVPAWGRRVCEWKYLLGGPLTVVVTGVVLAWWGSQDPAGGVNAGLLAAVSGLLAAQVFLATLGLTFGRGDTYRRAVDSLQAEDARLNELSAIDGTVGLQHLQREIASEARGKARLLTEALDPVAPPRLSRRGHEQALEDADKRRREKDLDWRQKIRREQIEHYGQEWVDAREGDEHEAERRQHEQDIARFGEERVANSERERQGRESSSKERVWVKSILAHTRAAEARIALICYLAAGVLALSILAGGLVVLC